MAQDPPDPGDYEASHFTLETLRFEDSAELVAARRERLLREARERASPERQVQLRKWYGELVRWVRTTPEGAAWLREAGEGIEREIARFEVSMRPDTDEA